MPSGIQNPCARNSIPVHTLSSNIKETSTPKTNVCGHP